MIPTGEVMRLTGLTSRRLEYWSIKGWVKPGGIGKGSGHHKSWPDNEVHIAVLMSRFIEIGLDVAKSARIARTLIETHDRDTARVKIGPDIWITVGGLPHGKGERHSE